MWSAHCAKLSKPYSSPWTSHLKVDVLGRQPGPHKPSEATEMSPKASIITVLLLLYVCCLMYRAVVLHFPLWDNKVYEVQ